MGASYPLIKTVNSVALKLINTIYVNHISIDNLQEMRRPDELRSPCEAYHLYYSI